MTYLDINVVGDKAKTWLLMLDFRNDGLLVHRLVRFSGGGIRAKMASKQIDVMKPRRSRGRPTLEDVAKLENRLLAVALSEFVAHGYGGTSMRRIVKAAEISKTTLYSRFSSKEHLFRAIMRQQIDNLAAATSLRSDDGPLDLERGLTTYANRTLENSLKGDLLLINRLIYSEALRFPELGAAAAERTQEGIRQIADFIRERAATDGIPCSNPESIAEAFILMLRGWYVNVMLANGKTPTAQRKLWVDRAVHALISSRSEW